MEKKLEDYVKVLLEHSLNILHEMLIFLRAFEVMY